MRPVTIRAVSNGFVVGVGCQEAVFESAKSLLFELQAYLADPKGFEKAWVEKYKLDIPLDAPAPAPAGAGIAVEFENVRVPPRMARQAEVTRAVVDR